MKRLSSKLTIYILLISLTFSSCKKEQDIPTRTDPSVPKVESNSAKETLASIKAMGYKDSEIVDIGDMYLVDGDIAFPKNRESLSSKGNASAPRTSQWSTANSVSYNVQNIVIDIDSVMVSGYAAALDSAIAIWNGIPNSRLTFSVYDGSIERTSILDNYPSYGFPAGQCSVAELPYNGRPGVFIYLETQQTDLMTFDQKVTTIAHEIGHLIGFRHTNWYGTESATGTDGAPWGVALYNALHILGTPTGTDTNSLMNRLSCGGSTISALSPADIIALTFLFPANPPVSGTVPVFRYFGGGDHFYTKDYSEMGSGNQGGGPGDYIFEGIAFYAFPTQVTNTVPVYQYYSSSRNDNFYSTYSGGFSGYTYIKIAFYAYTSQLNNSRPVYQYYNSYGTDHFWTLNPNEFVHSTGGYSYQLVPWYAY